MGRDDRNGGYIFCGSSGSFFVQAVCGHGAVPGHSVHDPGDLSPGAGAGIYWTAYYIVTDQMELASRTGFSAVKAAVAIVLGIIFVFEIPQSFFKRVLGKKRAGEPPGTSKMRRERKRIQVFTDFSQYAIILRVCILRIRKGWFYNGNFT